MLNSRGKTYELISKTMLVDFVKKLPCRKYNVTVTLNGGEVVSFTVEASSSGREEFIKDFFGEEKLKPRTNNSKPKVNTKQQNYIFFSYIDKGDLPCPFWATPVNSETIDKLEEALALLHSYVVAEEEDIESRAAVFHQRCSVPAELKDKIDDKLPQDYIPEIFTIGLMLRDKNGILIIDEKDVKVDWVKGIDDFRGTAERIHQKYCNEQS